MTVPEAGSQPFPEEPPSEEQIRMFNRWSETKAYRKEAAFLFQEERRVSVLQFCMTDAERRHVDPENIYGTMETKLPETATGPEP